MTDGNQDTNNIPETDSLGDYIQDNYEIFAIFGIFAAIVSVFTETSQISNNIKNIGVISSLVIFLLTSNSLIRRTGAELAGAIPNNQKLRLIEYVILVISLYGIFIAVFAIFAKYAHNAPGYIDKIGTVILSSWYLMVMYDAGAIRQKLRDYSPVTRVGKLARYPEYVGLILVLIMFGLIASVGDYQLIDDTGGSISILLLVAIFYQILLGVLSLLPIYGFETIVSYFQ